MRQCGKRKNGAATQSPAVLKGVSLSARALHDSRLISWGVFGVPALLAIAQLASTPARADPYAPRELDQNPTPFSPVYAEPPPANTSVSNAKPGEPPAPKPTTQAKLSFGVGARSLDDRLTQSDTAGAHLGLVGKRDFSPDWTANLQLDGLFYSGAADNILTGEGKPVNGVFLTEGSITWHAIQALKLKVGILTTTISTLPTSMMDTFGMPGASETLSVGGDLLKASLITRQLVPATGTLGAKYLPGDTTPLLIINTLLLESKPIHSNFELSGALSYYNFQNLSQAFAQDSRYTGNTAIGLGSTAAQFAYDFEGLEAATEMNFKLSPRWNYSLRGAAIYNVQAPPGQNLGGLAGTKLSYVEKTFKVGVEPLYYYNESDTLPGAFASLNLGNNNRQGPGASMTFDLPIQAISFYGSWARGNVIQSTPYQADRNLITVGAETTYAL